MAFPAELFLMPSAKQFSSNHPMMTTPAPPSKKVVSRRASVARGATKGTAHDAEACLSTAVR